ITDEWLLLRPTENETKAFGGLTVTPGHRFLSARGTFHRIEEILADDSRIVLADGSAITVQATRIVYSRETGHLYERPRAFQLASEGANAIAPQLYKGWKTYNFEVERLHTYIAGGVRVHNDSTGNPSNNSNDPQNLSPDPINYNDNYNDPQNPSPTPINYN